MTVDPWGGVHVFWVQGEEGGNTVGMIYYTRGDGQWWSEPHDLFASPRGMSYDAPYTVCDGAGTIHLLWAGVDGLHYSAAHALEADSIRAWRPDQVLVRTDRVGDSRLVVDQRDVLHVVYGQRSPGANVMYLRSEDGGFSWSDPTPISEIVSTDPQAPEVGHMAVDGHGGLHLVWTESYPPDWSGGHVLYARSSDGGVTWTRPMDLSDLSSDEIGDTNINLAVDSQDHLHVVWVCGVGTGRCYRYSRDGGDSWSGIQRLFEDMVGYGGLDAMASDPYGGVYWASLLRYPQAFYFSSLAGDRWIDPPQELLDRPAWGALAEAHWPQLVVGTGSLLHLVMTESDHGAIWYMRGESGRPSLPTPPIPLPEVSLTPEPTPAQTVITPQPTPLANEFAPSSLVSEDSYSLDPVLSAVAPVLLFVSTVIFANRIRSRH
jgi:hypothetical protein